MARFSISNQKSSIINFCSLYPPLNRPPDECVRGYVFAVSCTTSSTAGTLFLDMANCIRCGRQLPGLTFGKKICQWCKQHEAAQRGEDGDESTQPVMAVPWVRHESSISLTQIIFGANVAVFLGMMLASRDPLAFVNPMHEFS